MIWTSVSQKEFYGQVLSTEQLIESVFGRSFAEEFVKILLLSGLTDTQALDIANELVRNVEWIKTLSQEKRIELIKKITEYVKRGDTAEEAIEKAKKESEKYVKDVENAIYVFCDTITDAQLAGEALDFLRHVLNAMGPDAAKWLLDLLKDIYSRAFAQSRDREFANSRLKGVIEKVFKYPESKLYKCRLASVEISQLKKLEAEALRKTLEGILSSEGGEIIVDSFERTISKSGRITRTGEFEKGLYLIRVTRREDGKVFEWSTRKEEAIDELDILVPERFRDELIGKEVKITVIKYDYSLHFKSKGPNFYFSLIFGLIVGEAEIAIERVEPLGWSQEHGVSMKVKLKERSIDGKEIYLVFFEDGSVSTFSKISEESSYRATLSIEGNFLIVKYGNHKSIIPIVVQEWKEGEKYYFNISVEKREHIGLIKELMEIFGYDNVEKLRKKIKEGELELVAYFDNGRYATCGTEELSIGVPEGAKVLEYVIISEPFKPTPIDRLSDEEVERASKSDKALGDLGRDKLFALIEAGKIPKMKDAKIVKKEIYIAETDRRVDIVVETEGGRFQVIEVKSTTDPNAISDRGSEGKRQLMEYAELIKKYGLDPREFGRTEPIKDIDEYWVFVLYFDLKNKVVMYIPKRVLPP